MLLIKYHVINLLSDHFRSNTMCTSKQKEEHLLQTLCENNKQTREREGERKKIRYNKKFKTNTHTHTQMYHIIPQLIISSIVSFACAYFTVLDSVVCSAHFHGAKKKIVLYNTCIYYLYVLVCVDG